MFLFLKPFLPFLMLLIKPHPRKPLFPSWVCEFGLISVLLCQEFIHHSLNWVKDVSISGAQNPKSPPTMPFRFGRSLEAESAHEAAEAAMAGMRILDLPDLALELILAKLSPADLCNMVYVCRSLRDRCSSDHLWERHMREKWSLIIGDEARRKWELRVSSMGNFIEDEAEAAVNSNAWMGKLSPSWLLSRLNYKKEGGKTPSCLPSNSLISFFLALESGRFSFPAQVYNREYWHAGFVLSCYDAEISYNSSSNNFYARYPAHGKRIPPIEEVPWERLRPPSVGTSANDLYISHCLSELQPGDYIEIQWRRNKEFPYGWWYGVVGHLEMCDGSQHSCNCHASDTIVLEFNHYAPGSSWRRKTISRKEHREDREENNGFYGGIRKIQKKEEITKWMQFWPANALE
ncbi:hypothetical protein HPP92_019231 [Vanilla planifolia]|uniref:F-box domain-containing protein n=1 Tax=Vanilla planifolia TaxID=51239 RepID=A0A835UKJ5_VANPL|nr:hypothetical protein HPP92_019777 [Vanilla planifolia]KAG0465067.1 hypothetical protein HPP92_019231 [Vanilla planifolia]